MMKMTDDLPSVTVLMPVYNGEAYLAEAMESILVQTHGSFTFLILDDGSTDGTRELIRSYKDPRIRLVAGDENLGITRRLNQGLELCADELVARMDADDVSHPWRLAKQVAYLMKNPSCAMVATKARLIDAHGNYRGPYDPCGADPYYALHFDCYICHPSVMFRKSCVLEAGGYALEHAEDFDLWWRLSRGHRIHVMDEPLLSYRVHEDNVSLVHRNAEYREAERGIRQRNFSYLLGPEVVLPDAWASCYNNEFGPILEEKDSGEVIACLDLLDRATEAMLATENPNRNAGVIRYFAAAQKTRIIREVAVRLPLRAMIRLLFHYRRYALAAELFPRKIKRFAKRKINRLRPLTKGAEATRLKRQERIPSTPPRIAPLAHPEDSLPWSVMIPVYNCGPYLRETMLSVLDQDPGEAVMQIEVCDDASTEAGVEELVREVGRGRIGYFRQAVNVGHIRNFETCLNRSRGRIIHLLHGDDQVKKGFYEKMSELYAAHPETGAAFCRHIVHDEYDGSEWTSDEELPSAGILENWLERLASEQRIVTPSMTVRRSVYEELGGFYGVYYCEDWEMWLRIASRYPTGFVPEVLAEYRVRKGSNSDRCFLSGDNLRDIKWLIGLSRKYFTETQWKAVSARANKNYARFALDTARKIWERSGDRKGVRNQLRGGLELCRDRDILYPAARLLLKTLLPEQRNRLYTHMETEERIPASPPHIAPVTGGPRPLWSVMIPAYNCACYLPETLECVLRQDRGPDQMQIEVCDDASTDADVAALVRKAGGGRIGYYRQSANVGSLRNFETCLNRSRGRLIHLLHGDDTVRDGFYEKMEDLFSLHPDMGAAFCRFVTVDEFSGATLLSDLERPQAGILEGWLERLACKQRIQTPSIVVRREVYERLGGFYGRHYGEDWEMWLRIAAHYPVGYLPEVLAEYRKHADSISGRSILNGQNIRDLKVVMEVARQYFTAEQWSVILPRARRAYAAYAINTARSIWGRQQHKGGTRSQIAEALSLSASAPVLLQAAKLYVKMLLGIKR